MKKMIKVLVILLAILLLPPLAVIAHYGPRPHPDAYSGDLLDYDGFWIINGQLEVDTDWVLEIEGDQYHLYNDYQDFTGDIIFTPGNEDYGKPDTLWLEFDPALGIEIVLENQAGGLIDVSGQGLIFVREGHYVDTEEVEKLEQYTKEDMVGDWLFEVVTAISPDYPISMEMTNDEVMEGSITGDKRLILSFDNGYVYEVSEVMETRVPITRYRNMGGGRMYFENPKPIAPVGYKFIARVKKGGIMIIEAFPGPPGPVRVQTFMVLSRIEKEDVSEGGE